MVGMICASLHKRKGGVPSVLEIFSYRTLYIVHHMENLYWDGRLLSEALSDTNSDLAQFKRAHIQFGKYLQICVLVKKLQPHLLEKFCNGAVQEEPLPDSEVATQLFAQLGAQGMVVYAYIHHLGLEAEFLGLDEDELRYAITLIGNMLKLESDGLQNPGLARIRLLVKLIPLDVHSGKSYLVPNKVNLLI
jgi:hypothetical protein